MKLRNETFDLLQGLRDEAIQMRKSCVRSSEQDHYWDGKVNAFERCIAMIRKDNRSINDL
jgi:hypothetical protein